MLPFLWGSPQPALALPVASSALPHSDLHHLADFGEHLGVQHALGIDGLALPMVGAPDSELRTIKI